MEVFTRFSSLKLETSAPEGWKTIVYKKTELSVPPSLPSSYIYYCQMIAPCGMFFNASVCALHLVQAPEVVCLDQQVKMPSSADHEKVLRCAQATKSETKNFSRIFLCLVWLDMAGGGKLLAAPSQRLKGEKKGVPPAEAHRAVWGNPTEAFAAIKGGLAATKRAHVGIGDFVGEAGGTRWAMNLGLPSYGPLQASSLKIWNYKSPESRSWQVFCRASFCHNTFTAEGAMPLASRTVSIAARANSPEQSTTVNLTGVYASSLATCYRHITRLPSDALQADDQWTGVDKPVRVRRAMPTSAAITPCGPDNATPHLRGRTSISTLAVAPLNSASAYDAPNPSICQLSFHPQTLLHEAY